jgi:SAM-dependent methyltransferase
MNVRDAFKAVFPGVLQPYLKKSYCFYRAKTRVFRRYAREWRHAGSAVECPFCERTFSHFRATGVLERPFWQSSEGQGLLQLPYITVPNALCPRCGSGERHRLLYLYLRDRLSLLERPPTKLLDIAPNDFLWHRVFSEAKMEYVSIDLNGARRPTMLMSVTDLGFPDDTFDAIICYHVLEHIVDDIKAMGELYRVLKPGGWGILQVPIWARATVEDSTVRREEYATVYGHKDHARRYGLDYRDRLASVGFRVTVDDYVRQLPRDLVRHYGLLETEDIYFCEKI